MENCLDQAPLWLEQTSPDSPDREYFYCTGVSRNFNVSKELVNSDLHAAIFATAEESEAFAYQAHDFGWEWDNKPARSIKLKDIMLLARQRRFSSVKLMAYETGEWKAIKTWPCSVPLLGD